MSPEIFFRQFIELIIVPFQNLGTVWTILPVYTSLFIAELFVRKVSVAHAVGNGFVMIWAGLSWARHLSQSAHDPYPILPWVVVVVCIALGIFTVLIGLRRRKTTVGQLLGHARFTCYFVIMVYPLQSGLLPWTWTAVFAILIFALPGWVLLYFLGRAAAKVMKTQ